MKSPSKFRPNSLDLTPFLACRTRVSLTMPFPFSISFSAVLCLLFALVASTSAIHENFRFATPAVRTSEEIKATRTGEDIRNERRQRELEYQMKLAEVAESTKEIRAERKARLQQRKKRYDIESP